MKDSKSKFFLGLLALVMLVGTASPARAASDFPNKPITIIVGWSAGASEDMRARALAPRLGEVLGQPIVVVNKPGASGTLGLTSTAKSKPDGYTISSGSTSPILFTPHLQKLEYHPVKDFTYIAGTATQPYGIAVKSDAPWKTMEELLQYVKSNPGKIKYGTPGLGHYCHIYMEVVAKNGNLNWVHVPFKGDQPAITALLGGHVPVIAGSSALIPHAKSGKLRMLAVVAETRLASFPQVPTLKDFGFNFEMRANEVLGFCGPAGIPADIVKKYENAFKQAVDTPENKKILEQLDNEPKYRDSATFTRLIEDLYPRMGEMIKQVGLTDIAK
ncbi:MAG TPA: tripartite tricarboxylate transporter substrate binding protein [Thermodesulfobacteriota bacterium]|nr:tripartite tricarboxylate transporter substrate binding protein [Thermodesulfobacteriota bacterium]